MNTTITLTIELTEHQIKILPSNISDFLYKSCDKKIGELMIEGANKEIELETNTPPNFCTCDMNGTVQVECPLHKNSL